MSALALQRPPIRLPHRSNSLRALVRRYTTGSSMERKRGRPIISTLTPKLLTPEDVLDLSRKKKIRINFPGASILNDARLGYINTGKGGGQGGGDQIPFPPHSRGFLYYHSEPHAAPLEGGLRFRVTSDNSPSSFPRGQDLLAPWGLPWQIILPQISCNTDYIAVSDQLLHENLVKEEQLSRCRDIFGERLIYPQYILYRLDSPFLLNFASPIWLTAVGDELHTLPLAPLKDRDSEKKPCNPWTGSAVARFERSPRHPGRRVVRLRFLKIVQPVECTMEGYNGRVLEPEEGQLLTVSSYRHAAEPWAYDIDRKTRLGAALRVLWDKSGIS
ncbi:hypothetical protein C8R44DRAFT_740806 [Mycena epipterygia]|nr:hypothetical protein C8R44DRAFT_740806 [Mycena epipterygia]